MAIIILVIILILGLYTLRHYVFTCNRLFGLQLHPCLDIECGNWPSVTILIPAHNEEQVIADSLNAMLAVDYPTDLLQIIPVNDRSTDQTKLVIDEIAANYTGRIFPFHRTDGKPGKPAALKDAMQYVKSEIILIFDADYIAPPSIIKQLVAPFFDPEVGAVMGRVVPINAGTNLLTRLQDLERAGGYQVNQQARMNLKLVPQFGGTVGGIRSTALDQVGGWKEDVLAEDTDLTFRLLQTGWETVYQNRAECYEEVPEAWPVRLRQIKRWAKGHDQVMFSQVLPLLKNRHVPLRQKLDGALLLGTYAVAPLMLLGWFTTIFLFYQGGIALTEWAVLGLTLTAFSTLGNLAAFFEIVAAVLLDGDTRKLRLMPFNFMSFLVCMFAASRAFFELILQKKMKRSLMWDKTERYRRKQEI